jgi:hypothetical protein
MMIIPENIEELKRGYIRYEVVRRLNPNEFSRLYEWNLKSGVPFDDLIDEIIDGIAK